MKIYTHSQIHKLLLNKWPRKYQGIRKQALFCPYYVKLQGVLGYDWGVIVNPESKRFGEVVFEHDKCGCSTFHDINYQQREYTWLKEDKFKARFEKN